MSSGFIGDNSGMNYTWPKRTIFIAITSKDLKVNPKCFWAESQSSMQQTTPNCWQPYQIGSESSLQMSVEVNCFYIYSDIMYVSLIWFEVPILSTGINFQQTSHHETTSSYKEYFLRCRLHMVKILCSSEHKLHKGLQLVSLLASSKSTHRQLRGFLNLLTNHSQLLYWTIPWCIQGIYI